MSNLLLIETATHICSAALSVDGNLLINKENLLGQSHSKLLGVFVEEIMNYCRANSLKLDAIVVSSGPGSYTGLRIGVSEAKGLSYGLDIPLIAIETPKVMAWALKDKYDTEALLCPMIDARRMEVYATFFDTSLNVVSQTSADIITPDSYLDLLNLHPIVFFGNGAEKCIDIINHPNASFIDHIHPHASQMIALGEEAFNNGDFVEKAYFEPFYLKEFVATVPKNKIF